MLYTMLSYTPCEGRVIKRLYTMQIYMGKYTWVTSGTFAKWRKEMI